jgi:hypothetical protein
MLVARADLNAFIPRRKARWGKRLRRQSRPAHRTKARRSWKSTGVLAGASLSDGDWPAARKRLRFNLRRLVAHHIRASRLLP